MAEYTVAKTLDYKGLACPMPIVKISQVIGSVAVGDVIEVHTTDPGVPVRFPRVGEDHGPGDPRDEAGAGAHQDFREATEIGGDPWQSQTAT